MLEPGSVTRLLIELHSDDTAVRDQAMSDLVTRYAAELLALIAARMTQRLQQRVAPEDILQDVLISFCNRLKREGSEFVNRDQFLGLVMRMALNQVCSAARREERQRRDIRREQPMSGPADHPPIDAPDPTVTPPDVVAEVTEEVERLLSLLPPECRQVAQLRFEGDTVEEIAVKIDRTTRTVERRLELIRTLWEAERSDR